MELRHALGIGAGTVAAFTGGGGKTSLILRLAGECTGAGLRTVYTTTTHIYPPPLTTVAVPDAGGDLGAVRGCLAAGRPCCVYAAPGPAGKLAGVPPALVGRLPAVADVVLVEADGSRGFPLKCPADHEPVIPPAANLVVPVAGISALGRPLNEHWVHRPERAAALLGVAPGITLEPAHLAQLLLASGGCTRGRPPAARVVPVINQVDSAADLAAARAVAAALLHLGATRVVLTAAATAQVVRAVLDGEQAADRRSGDSGP